MFQFDVDIFQIGFFQSPRRDNMKTSIITIHNRYLSTFHSSKAEIPERWICFQAEQGLSKDPSSFNAATLQHQCFPSSQSRRPSLKLTVRPWKWMVGRWISFWDGPISGAFAVSFREGIGFVLDLFIGKNVAITFSWYNFWSLKRQRLMNPVG